MKLSFAHVTGILILFGAPVFADESANPSTLDPAEWECDDGFDWESRGPLDLLQRLKEPAEFSVCEPHPEWVRREHIAALIALLDSEEPCQSVKLVVSSIIGGPSTIGNEAAYLILGFQRGRYPSKLVSNRKPIDKGRIRDWWAEEGGLP